MSRIGHTLDIFVPYVGRIKVVRKSAKHVAQLNYGAFVDSLNRTIYTQTEVVRHNHDV